MEESEDSVTLMTLHSAKGLEFNFVIIPQFAEGYFPYNHKSDDEEEYETFMFKMRNLVYVSMTRAKNALYITWWGNGGSRFINDMDKSMYDFEGSDFIIKAPKASGSVVKTTATVEDVVKPVQKATSVSGTTNNSSSVANLAGFITSKGLKTVDKRPNGGCLWVVGGKEIDPIIKESKANFSFTKFKSISEK